MFNAGGIDSVVVVAVIMVVVAAIVYVCVCVMVLLQTNAGAPGTAFYEIGVTVGSRNRKLVIDNGGRNGGSAMLADANRSLYALDTVLLSRVGRLAWYPVSTALSIPSTLSTTVLQGDAASTGRLTVSVLTTLLLPDPFTISGMEVVVSGTLSGVTDLVMDGGSTLTLSSSGRTTGQSSGVFRFSSLVIQGNSNMDVTSFSVMNVSTSFVVLDSSSVTLSGLSGSVLTADVVDVGGALASLTFSGYWTIVASTVYVRKGAYISGDSGGNAASVGW